MNQRGARRCGLAAVLALFLPFGCRCQRAAPADPLADVAACAAACSALVTAGCRREGSPENEQDRCVAACTQRSHELLPARCETERRTYLECVAKAVFDCKPLSCSASVCLEQGMAPTGCAEPFSRFKACVEPCLHAGTAHVGQKSIEESGRSRNVQTEIVRAGCAQCSVTKPGAGAGAPCQAHSVCGQSCCRCPDGRAWFLARTCADGVCVEGELACRLGRIAAPADPCADPEN